MQGNHYCSRDYGPSSGINGEERQTGYHYSNRLFYLLYSQTSVVPKLTVITRDGSYYYSNPNGSKYYNDGKGYDRYTAPNGQTFERHESQDQGCTKTS